MTENMTVERADAGVALAEAVGQVGGEPRPVLRGRPVDGEGERRRGELGHRLAPSDAHPPADGWVGETSRPGT
jgi:hypothetical protein